jgi:hypothetical protein
MLEFLYSKLFASINPGTANIRLTEPENSLCTFGKPWLYRARQNPLEPSSSIGRRYSIRSLAGSYPILLEDSWEATEIERWMIKDALWFEGIEVEDVLKDTMVGPS